MIVFDEAHRVKDSKRLEQLAREGRAFGVGIVIGTQFPDDIPETMAGNLARQLFLMNNQATHRRLIVTLLLGTTATSEAKGLLDKLGQLRPLQGLFTNTHNLRQYPATAASGLRPSAWRRLDRGGLLLGVAPTSGTGASRKCCLPRLTAAYGSKASCPSPRLWSSRLNPMRPAASPERLPRLV
jgi:hypothetical protein